MRQYWLLRATIAMFALLCDRSDAEGEVVKRMSAGSIEAALKPLPDELARPYGRGFVREAGVYVCDNGDDAKAQRGVLWSMVLNQAVAAPLVASAWAKPEGPEGAAGADFSLYLDLEYMDGTPLWGQVASFDPTPEAGWHRREVVVMPDKPVRRVTCYLLCRSRAGMARFREPSFGVMEADGLARFDGAVAAQARPPRCEFLLRDVAQNSDYVVAEPEALGVRMEARQSREGGSVRYDVALADLSGKDRALTLAYTLPLEAGSLVWFHDPLYARTLDGGRAEAVNATRHPVGANGLLSRYPFGAVSVAGRGVAIGLDPATPLVYRIGCQPKTRELYITCDIGLAPEKATGSFRFCTFTFDAAGGFRAALARYYALYPEAFKTRVREQGVWMPFAAVSKVEGWEDFGFRFKEGDGETAWDDAHGLLTFRYTEPMTWWMALKGEGPRTLARGAEEARRLAASGDRAAQAWSSSAFEDERGRAPGRVLDTPWCNGVVWSMNSAPGVAGAVTDFTNKFGKAYLEKQYGTSAKADCDGEYIDSAEAYVTEELDYRRSHFAGMERPLCYALASRKVGIYKGLIGFEYVRAIEREMRARGRLTMANSTPISWFWLAPLLDVMGTETDWNPGGTWRPMSGEELLYRRALCKGKPYCFLMNTDFSKFPHEAVEKYMKRALAYGMFPGFFSADASTGHYFTRPELYERDRPLFKKFIPLCRRVAEAGWEPLTGVTSDNPSVAVERFGSPPGPCYLTVYNGGGARQKAQLSKADELSGSCREWVSGGTVDWRNGQAQVELAAGDVLVIEIGRDPRGEP